MCHRTTRLQRQPAHEGCIDAVCAIHLPDREAARVAVADVTCRVRCQSGDVVARIGQRIGSGTQQFQTGRRNLVSDALCHGTAGTKRQVADSRGNTHRAIHLPDHEAA